MLKKGNVFAENKRASTFHASVDFNRFRGCRLKIFHVSELANIIIQAEQKEAEIEQKTKELADMEERLEMTENKIVEQV